MVLRRLTTSSRRRHPAYVVWELTLRCDQPCTHCGSRAGDSRPTSSPPPRRWTWSAARGHADAGGRAHRRRGLPASGFSRGGRGDRRRRASARRMTTGGRGITAKLARDAAEAGLYAASVSIDGLGEHPRPDPGRAAAASPPRRRRSRTSRRRASAPPPTPPSTGSTRRARGDLRASEGAGVSAWQVQLTAALGRAADRPELLLQPWDLLDVVPRVARLKERAFEDGITLMPAQQPRLLRPRGDAAPLDSQGRYATTSTAARRAASRWASSPTAR